MPGADEKSPNVGERSQGKQADQNVDDRLDFESSQNSHKIKILLCSGKKFVVVGLAAVALPARFFCKFHCAVICCLFRKSNMEDMDRHTPPPPAQKPPY